MPRMTKAAALQLLCQAEAEVLTEYPTPAASPRAVGAAYEQALAEKIAASPPLQQAQATLRALEARQEKARARRHLAESPA